MLNDVVSIEFSGYNVGDKAIIQLSSGKRIQRILIRAYDEQVAKLIAPTPTLVAAVFLQYTSIQ